MGSRQRTVGNGQGAMNSGQKEVVSKNWAVTVGSLQFVVNSGQ
jgi:hypothetical protein